MAKPNILIFMTDHQRGDTAPPYSRAITPHLDRLAREGVTFAQTYCPSPHCCPSRATFFTGLYPSEHGVWNNVGVGNALSRGPFPGIRFFSDDLREAGYRLYFSGKWHVSELESPVDRGWLMNYPKPGPQRTPEAFSRPLTYEWGFYTQLAREPETESRGRAQILRPGYGTYTAYGVKEQSGFDEATLAGALEFIRSKSRADEPWCQFIGMTGPHDPYFVPQRYLDMYRLEDIQLPVSFNDSLRDKPNLYRRTRDRFDQLSAEEQRECLLHYLAYCSYEDDLFGQVLAALEETGQYDSTMIVYLSDHGDYAGDHGLWAKGLPCFRGAYHVPAVVRWPQGTAAGQVVDEFVSLADFAPTFLEAAEVKAERAFSGSSLMPFLRGETPAGWRDAVFTQTNGNELYGIQRSVMTREWKYVYNGFDYDELYHLAVDPHEMRNLAGDPAYRNVIRDMSRRLWRFAYEHQDVCINRYVMVAHAPFGPSEAFGESGISGAASSSVR
jgi:arylsulfatase A-like enzyme